MLAKASVRRSLRTFPQRILSSLCTSNQRCPRSTRSSQSVIVRLESAPKRRASSRSPRSCCVDGLWPCGLKRVSLSAMSYTSESTLPDGTTLTQVRELVTLLGYRKVNDGLMVPNRTDSLFWYEGEDYRSYVGVELDIYREDKEKITVTTRSRLGRSYWDLINQNKTLKLIRDLLGGHFTTDAGQNRYWRPDEKPPTPLASGCFIARWRFHNNAMMRARIYLRHRDLDAPIAKDSGPVWITWMNKTHDSYRTTSCYHMLLPFEKTIVGRRSPPSYATPPREILP